MQYVIIGLFIFIMLAVIVPSCIIVKRIYKPKKRSYQYRIEREVNAGMLDLDWYDNLPKQCFIVKSNFGYDLYGEYYPNSVPTNKTVVVVHGFRANSRVSLKFAKLFLDMGLNAVVFDNTNCGNSGGVATTMGVRESVDIGSIVDKARELTGDNAVIGLHGVSLGASSSIMYSCTDNDMAFVIADCGFSNMKKEMWHNCWHVYHMIPQIYIPTASLISKITMGYYFGSVSPYNDIVKHDGLPNIPIMFIHGKKDEMTPCYMMDDMYSVKKGIRRKVLFENAIHARSIVDDYGRYRSETMKFLTDIQIL